MDKLVVLLSLAAISFAEPSLVHGTAPIAHSISIAPPAYRFAFGKVLLAPYQTLDAPVVQNTIVEAFPSTKEVEPIPVADKTESATVMSTTTTAEPEVLIDVRGQIPEVEEPISTLPKTSQVAFASPAVETNAVNTLSIVPEYSFVPSAPLANGYGLNVVSGYSLGASVVPALNFKFIESGSAALEAPGSVSVESRKKAPLYTEARIQEW